MKYISKYKQDIQQLKKIVKNSNTFSEVLRYYNMSTGGANPTRLKQFLNENNISYDHFVKKNNETCFKPKIDLQDIFSNKVPYHNTSTLKHRLFKEGYKENKCELCGITSWNNKNLVMQLHHKDGNRNNNSLDNLQILCPNCHAQTETYGGKNCGIPKQKKQIPKKYNNEIIINNVILLWEQGYLINEISKKMDIRKPIISFILKENGVSTEAIKFRAVNITGKRNRIYQYDYILMIDKNSEKIVKKFNCINECIKFVKYKYKSTDKTIKRKIYDNCNNKIKSVYGYIWKYQF